MRRGGRAQVGLAIGLVLIGGIAAGRSLAAVSAQSPAGIPAAPAPPLLDTLRLAGGLLERFSREAAGIVYEEDYLQQVPGRLGLSRQLRSDVLIMADSNAGWIEFRDVFEVDKKPVRDRDDRLVKLFSQPKADAAEQARRIVQEGARFNLDADGLRITRTLNLPTIALWFLRTVDQSRFGFTRTGFTTIDGRRVAIVTFQETGRPRFIASPDGAAAQGTFWIEPETGVVVRSQLLFTSRNGLAQVAASILVDFALEPKLQVWLPRRMEEHYVAASGTIEGRATYSKFRKFDVAVEERTN